MRISEKQMTLGEMIAVLKRKDRDQWVTFDFVHFRPDCSVHSYRGYYEDLAIGYQAGGDSKVGQLLDALEKANGESFYGHKGGEYAMDSDTVVWVAQDNESGGTAVVDIVDDSWRILIKTEMID